MTEFIINPDELSDATKKEVEEIIKTLEPGTIKIIYQEIDGKKVKFYIQADKKGDLFMGKPGLSEADKAWIASLIKPINERLTNIENRLDVVEQDIKAIKECPTIKKELKNN